MPTFGPNAYESARMESVAAPVILISNTAWYLYNFRRGTLAELVAQGHRVVTIAPPDRYATRLVEELAIAISAGWLASAAFALIRR